MTLGPAGSLQAGQALPVMRPSPPPASGLGQVRRTPGWDANPHQWGQGRGPAPGSALFLAPRVSGRRQM